MIFTCEGNPKSVILTSEGFVAKNCFCQLLARLSIIVQATAFNEERCKIVFPVFPI
jgi:hypothetical protein